jgi:succinyl-diaminopimelate desuccinylase
MNAVDLTRELVRFDTINPPGEEEACARHLGGILERAGFRVEEHPHAPRRTSLVARLGNAAAGAPLCFTGHIDVVPLGGAPWSHEPFAGELADGRVYGRGTTDMKAGVAAFVVAAARLAPRLASTPGLVLVITAGEETACEGARYLAQTARALPKAGAIVGAAPTSNAPCVGHKGALWLEARTTGVTAHGSMPERGVNAVYKAARAVLMLEKYEFGVAPHPILGPPTLNVGNIRGGLNVNSVPDAASIGIDIRTIPAVRHAALRDHLAGHLGPDVALTAVADAEGVWSDPDAPWMRQVFEVAERVAGAPRDVRAAPYFTDASALTPAMGGAPTVILGPGEAGLAHQTDEYCVVERIEQSVEIFAELTRRWCSV